MNETDFEKMLRNIVEEPNRGPSSVTQDGMDVAMNNEGIVIEIPKSYEEIYKLSGKNRKKNKDKKRSLDTESSMDSVTFQAEKSTDFNIDETDQDKDGFDINQYFNSNCSNKEKSAEETVWLFLSYSSS
jgi:hypothetical protein